MGDSKVLLAALCGAAAGAVATTALHRHLASGSDPAAAPSSPESPDDAGLDLASLEQLEPTQFEEAGERDERLLRRVETVLRRRTARVVLVLERLCDGHNYAAVLRTAEAQGIQHVWLIAPPQGEARYESAKMQKRRSVVAKAGRIAAVETRRKPGDLKPQPGSRRQQKLEKKRQAAQNMWGDDVKLDQEHAAFGKSAARFLSVREFDSSEGAGPQPAPCLQPARPLPWLSEGVSVPRGDGCVA